jgi:hypothetical protein
MMRDATSKNQSKPNIRGATTDNNKTIFRKLFIDSTPSVTRPYGRNLFILGK